MVVYPPKESLGSPAQLIGMVDVWLPKSGRRGVVRRLPPRLEAAAQAIRAARAAAAEKAAALEAEVAAAIAAKRAREESERHFQNLLKSFPYTR